MNEFHVRRIPLAVFIFHFPLSNCTEIINKKQIEKKKTKNVCICNYISISFLFISHLNSGNFTFVDIKTFEITQAHTNIQTLVIIPWKSLKTLCKVKSEKEAIGDREGAKI